MIRKKRVLFVSNMFPRDEHDFFGIFVKKNFLSFQNSSYFEINNKILIRGRGLTFLRKFLKYLKFYFQCFLYQLKSNFDLIIIHYPTYSAIPFLFYSYFLRKPIILNFHGSDFFLYHWKSKLMRALIFPIVNNSNLIIVPSNFLKEKFAKSYKTELAKVYVFPSDGIDSKVFRKKEVDRADADFIIGYVGRLDVGKGLDTLFKAINCLKTKIPNLKCKIAGDGGLLKELEKTSKDLKLESTISFFGPLFNEDLVDFYNKIDVLVFPTELNESLGLVGLESLFCGTPVISSEIGGIRGYLKHEINGLFFKPGDLNDMVLSIYRFYKDEDLRSKLIFNSQKSVRNFEKQIVNRQLFEKLNKLI